MHNLFLSRGKVRKFGCCGESAGIRIPETQGKKSFGVEFL